MLPTPFLLCGFDGFYIAGGASFGDLVVVVIKGPALFSLAGTSFFGVALTSMVELARLLL